MSAILTMIAKLLSDIFIGIGNEQLKTLGETNEIKKESGSLEIDISLNDIIDKYSDLE